MYDWKLPQVLDSFFSPSPFIPPSIEYTKTMFKHCSEPSRALIKGFFSRVKHQYVLVETWHHQGQTWTQRGDAQGEALLLGFPSNS